MVYVLFAAVAAGAAVGGVRSLSSPSTRSAEPAPAAVAETAQHAGEPSEADEPSPGASVEGQVLEAIEVPNYSYLRLGAPGSEGTWVAVPTAGLAVGAQARLREGMRMENFASTALKRTFPVIYFGTLEGGRTAHGMAPVDATHNPHANGADPHAGGAPPADPDAMKAAHPALGAVEIKPVERAKGADGKTVAEVIDHRTQLVGKTVRLHATVVKSTPGILGKTYLHLRDGSGDAAKGTNDVVVTTQTTPAVGDTILIEGIVAIDRDIGAGYKFPTIIDDAKILPH
jgi:hypothetical protein